MKRSTSAIALVALVLLSLALGACGTSPTDAPTAASGVTLTDALGTKIDLAQVPQRVVIAGKNTLPVVETFFLFPEAGQRLAGVGVGKQKPGQFLKVVDPTFEQKPTLAVESGPEQISALKPDAVVMKSINAEKLGKPLTGLGIPVVNLDLETPDQFLRDVGTLGQLLGNESRAQEIVAFYQAKLDQVNKALDGLKDEDKPRTLIVQYSEQGGENALSVPSASYLQTIETEMAGGLPVWKEAAQGGGWNVVNLEQVAAWNPDVIVVVDYASDPREAVAKLKADPKWQALKAVQDGRLYGFAGDIYSWDQPDPRWILGVQWLAGKLHPDRFPGLDMQQEASTFFREMYGLDEAAVQANIVPQLKGDVK